MRNDTIVISHLDEKHKIKRIHIQWPDKADTKYLTYSQWLKEKATLETYCKKNKMRLIHNFTGSIELPKPIEEEEL